MLSCDSYPLLVLILDPHVHLFFGLKRPIEITGRSTAVRQEGGTGNERASVAHEQFCHIGHLIGCTWTSSRALGKHILVEVSARAVEFINGQGRYDDTWGNVVEPSAALTPFDAFCHDALFIAALGKLICMQGVTDSSSYSLSPMLLSQFATSSPVPSASFWALLPRTARPCNTVIPGRRPSRSCCVPA